jgi:hypothetical protein
MENESVKQQALQKLARIADMMENCEPDDPMFKELKKDYKSTMEAAGITKGGKLENKHAYTLKQVRESRIKALEKAKFYLDDIERWSVDLPKLQSGQVEYIAISYLSNYKGMNCEINLEIPDSFYADFAGVKCYKAVKGLFIQKQLQSYPSIEYGLIKYAMELIKGPERREFFDKYAVRYNNRLQEAQNRKNDGE